MTGRYVNYLALSKKNFAWPFAQLGDTFSSSDLVVANLETPILTDCLPRIDGMSFCAASGSAIALKNAGFDLLTLANNHTLNHGQAGLNETINLLQKNNLQALADYQSPQNNFYTQKIGETVYGFMSLDDVSTTTNLSDLSSFISTNKQKVDVLFLVAHFGTEYTYQPSTRQQQLAHLAIDSGADIVIGNHPHWFQPLEFYHDGVILYSHGNFVFDQMWSEETKEGLVVDWIFADGKIDQIKVSAVYITDYGLANTSFQRQINNIETNVSDNKGKNYQPKLDEILVKYNQLNQNSGKLINHQLIFSPLPIN